MMDGEAVADRLTNTVKPSSGNSGKQWNAPSQGTENGLRFWTQHGLVRLYEDMIAGRISEQNFNTMLETTSDRADGA